MFQTQYCKDKKYVTDYSWLHGHKRLSAYLSDVIVRNIKFFDTLELFEDSVRQLGDIVVTQVQGF